MFKCATCSGFVPTHAQSCPNCRSKKVAKCLKSGATVVGVGMIGLTLMACYGAPPDYYKTRADFPPEEPCKDKECEKDLNHKETPAQPGEK